MKFLRNLFQEHRWLGQSVGVAGLAGLFAMGQLQSSKYPSKTAHFHVIKAQKRSHGPSISQQESVEVVETFPSESFTLVHDTESNSAGVENAVQEKRFENWMLCRSDTTEVFFSLDSLSQGQGSVSINYPRRTSAPLKETFENTQVQEFIKSPNRFLLRLSDSSNLSHTQILISTTKGDNDTIYQGKLDVLPTANQDGPRVKRADINCTPLTKAASNTQASL